ncbi:MAG TPA: hypothetical protein VGR57_09495 [Ktedonobacterales bacterium]|nr:hypothetical protein [Ktedonobacterales bacterium]
MAGYSGTPLVKKLGIRAGARIALLRAPAGFAATLGALPPGATLAPATGWRCEVVLLFVATRARLAGDLPNAMSGLAAAGGLWLAWPKRAAGVPTDLTEEAVRAAGLAAGLVDNKVCAIDDTWSGLRFVVRVADRARWPRAGEHREVADEQ